MKAVHIKAPECDCQKCKIVKFFNAEKAKGNDIKYVLLTRMEAHALADCSGVLKSNTIHEVLFKNGGQLVHDTTGEVIEFRVQEKPIETQTLIDAIVKERVKPNYSATKVHALLKELGVTLSSPLAGDLSHEKREEFLSRLEILFD